MKLVQYKMKKQLIKLADLLDSKGLIKEADEVDSIVQELSEGLLYITIREGLVVGGIPGFWALKEVRELIKKHPEFDSRYGLIASPWPGENKIISLQELKSTVK